MCKREQLASDIFWLYKDILSSYIDQPGKDCHHYKLSAKSLELCVFVSELQISSDFKDYSEILFSYSSTKGYVVSTH